MNIAYFYWGDQGMGLMHHTSEQWRDNEISQLVDETDMIMAKPVTICKHSGYKNQWPMSRHNEIKFMDYWG